MTNALTNDADILDEQELEALEQHYKEREQEHEKERHKVKARLSGHTFLKRSHLPMYWLARLREMHVGDTFIMASLRHHDDEMGFEGVAGIYAQKESKGVYKLHSNWTLLSKPSRPHRFSELTFKIEKGGIIAFTGKHSPENQHSFVLTSRYIQWLLKHVTAEDNQPYFDLGLPPFLSGVNVDKNSRTTRRFYPKGKHNEKGIHYLFDDEQMPKSMMECIVDYGIASGAINFS